MTLTAMLLSFLFGGFVNENTMIEYNCVLKENSVNIFMSDIVEQ